MTDCKKIKYKDNEYTLEIKDALLIEVLIDLINSLNKLRRRI